MPIGCCLVDSLPFTPLAWTGYEWPTLLTRTIPSAAVLLDAENRVLCWNPAAESLFGYSTGEALGRAFYRWLFPADSWEDGISADRVEPVPVWHITRELHGVHKEGRPLIVELSLTGFFQDGQRHTLGVLRDLTEFKQGAARRDPTS